MAAAADLVASTRVSFQTVIVCQPEMMFWTPCARRILAGQRDRLQAMGLQRDDDRVRETVVGRRDCSILLLVLTSICSKIMPAFWLSQPGMN